MKDYEVTPCSYITFYEQHNPSTPQGAPLDETLPLVDQMRRYYGERLYQFKPFDPAICVDCPSETRRVNATILFQLSQMIRFVQSSIESERTV
jgi:hypothetical protein